MRILPFIIILFCCALIFKSGVLIEKHLFMINEDSSSVNSSSNITQTTNSKIEYLSEDKPLEHEENKTEVKTSEHENVETGEKASEHGSGEKPAKAPEPYPDEDFIKRCITPPAKFNDIEVKILENLSNRRKELEKREEIISEKEKLIGIAVTQAEEKLKQLKSLESSVTSLLNQYNEKEDMKIQSLVRIYQAMKPEDAAKIFDELDMEILLKVINKMKENNAASIIASMNPEKAKDLTIRIAQQRRLEDVVNK